MNTRKRVQPVLVLAITHAKLSQRWLLSGPTAIHIIFLFFVLSCFRRLEILCVSLPVYSWDLQVSWKGPVANVSGFADHRASVVTTGPFIVMQSISSSVPAPPPFMCNYVCTDLPAVGLVNRAHLASCRQNCQEGGRAGHTCLHRLPIWRLGKK